jgi:hypothetical protein
MDRRDVPASAITYREWLVGQAVAALAARLYPTRDADSLPPDFLADSAVEIGRARADRRDAGLDLVLQVLGDARQVLRLEHPPRPAIAAAAAVVA